MKAKFKLSKELRIVGQIGLGILLMAANASAAAVSSMPWDTPITNIAGSITGPVAYGMTIGGAAVGFWTSIRHGELGHFAQAAGVTALAGVALARSPAVLTALGVTGGLI